ncbi:hypothetical protein OSB04_020021 [Centaurea solstitialis]|uniref:Fe2OG dioxygenase domain-containing protein n=1 Tax=Centaurea solstitialis TaxID=347529 RepID=A0AA38TAY3_9ASTR|nr:hypothetical protein OSB04_020021 [Centaurea solstitialis]
MQTTMSISSQEVNSANGSNYDRQSELKAFDDSKSGVKGLVDAGLLKIPPTRSKDDIPIIDLQGTTHRGEVVENVRHAAENWGFFQIINHGIPKRVLDEIIDGVRGFHEMETEEKIKYYSRDHKKPFFYVSNFHLFTGDAATWCDSFLSVMAPTRPQSEEVPTVCREILSEYSDHIIKLGFTLLELFSEALGLEPNHLRNLGCAQGLFLLGHYYPPCPEPELTLGANCHTDAGFFTILLQDLLGGLQVLHQNDWVNVSPIPGALVVNISDLLQARFVTIKPIYLVTNDKFKSAHHRVLAPKGKARISVGSFFRPFNDGIESIIYRPIKELVSEENPCVYRDTNLKEYVALRAKAVGMSGTSALDVFKVESMKALLAWAYLYVDLESNDPRKAKEPTIFKVLGVNFSGMIKDDLSNIKNICETTGEGSGKAAGRMMVIGVAE